MKSKENLTYLWDLVVAKLSKERSRLKLRRFLKTLKYLSSAKLVIDPEVYCYKLHNIIF